MTRRRGRLGTPAKAWVSVACAAWAIGATAGPALTAPELRTALTLDAAIEAALRQHPDLEALRHAAAALRWQQEAVGVYAAPELKWSTNSIQAMATEKGAERRQSIALQWDVPHLQAAELRRASLNQTLEASRLELARARHELVQRVRDVYQSLLTFAEEERQAEAILQLRLQVLELVRWQLRLGRATGLDEVEARTRWIEAAQALARLRDERTRLGHRLDSLVGFRTDGLNLPDERAFDALVGLTPPPAAASASLLAQRPDLQLLWARCQAAHLADRDRARQNDWGLKNVELNHTPASGGKPASTGVQLLLGLPIPGRASAAAAAAESAYLSCQAQARSAQDQAARELSGLVSQFQTLRDEQLRGAGELVRLATERLRLAHLAVRQGNLASADLLLARIAQAQAKQQAATLLRQLRFTALEMELAVGALSRWVGGER